MPLKTMLEICNADLQPLRQRVDELNRLCPTKCLVAMVVSLKNLGINEDYYLYGHDGINVNISYVKVLGRSEGRDVHLKQTILNFNFFWITTMNEGHLHTHLQKQVIIALNVLKNIDITTVDITTMTTALSAL